MIVENTFVQQQTSKIKRIFEHEGQGNFRFGSDSTRAVLQCEESSGVFSESLQPKSLEHLRKLEMGKIRLMESLTSFVFCLLSFNLLFVVFLLKEIFFIF